MISPYEAAVVCPFITRCGLSYDFLSVISKYSIIDVTRKAIENGYYVYVNIN